MPTEAQKRANYKYQDKKELIRIWCDPEEKKIIKEKAETAEKSVNRFMLDLALGEKMKEKTRKSEKTEENT